MKKHVLIAATGMLMMAGMPMMAQAESDNDRRSNFSSERQQTEMQKDMQTETQTEMNGMPKDMQSEMRVRDAERHAEKH